MKIHVRVLLMEYKLLCFSNRALLVLFTVVKNVIGMKGFKHLLKTATSTIYQLNKTGTISGFLWTEVELDYSSVDLAVNSTFAKFPQQM
jgi:hypothetical protein